MTSTASPRPGRRRLLPACLGLAGLLLVVLAARAVAGTADESLSARPGLQPIGPYVLSPDGRTLGLIVAPAAGDVRPGSTSYAATVEESDARVVVSVTPHTVQGPGAGAAVGVGATRSLDVILDRPLGDRVVVDAATGRAVSAAGR